MVLRTGSLGDHSRLGSIPRGRLSFIRKGRRACAALVFLLIGGCVAAQEICNNGVDDDGNGLIDLNDPACPCSTVLSPPGTASYIRNHSFEEQGCCPYGLTTPVAPWFDCITDWHQATAATSDYFHSCGNQPPDLPLPPPDGEGAVGFISGFGYKEYVGTCLTWPLPAQPLQAGVTYTLSLWMTMFAGANLSNGRIAITTDVFPDPYPLTLFGYPNACVPFPVPTYNCIGDEPGWIELGRIYHQPDGQWNRVSITFTPTQDIHSVIIGAACDLPISYDQGVVMTVEGPLVATPYTIIDDLFLTIAADQVMSPVTRMGDWCTEDLVLQAAPPAGATGYQWYLDGVALVGSTAPTLDASALGLGTGTYTLASTFNGECLLGNSHVLPPSMPAIAFSIQPDTGCVPLTVLLADSTLPTPATVRWDLGDGSGATGPSIEHAYTAPGSYDMTLTVTTDQGCAFDTTLVDAVIVYPAPNATIAVSPPVPSVEDTGVLLTDTDLGGDAVGWSWDLGALPPGHATGQSVSATLPGTPGAYPITLVVTTAHGCTDTVRTTLVVGAELEMPNVFSPNGDGDNDRFIPLGVTGIEGHMDIYNRWGQVIFSTDDLAVGWAGQHVPEGTYFYLVHSEGHPDQVRKGHVTLVR